MKKNTLQDFFDNARSHGICERGLELWTKCGSKKRLIDLALSGFGMQYVAESIASGVGIHPDNITGEFAPFINGRYTRHADGYSSEVYCQTDVDAIEIHATAVLIVDFNGIIIIRYPCELHIVNSKVEVAGEGRGAAYLYNSEITNNPTSSVVVKEDKKYGL